MSGDPVANAEVRAAGGVVLRREPLRVLVVHRPRYDDWTLPKGKLDPGEDWPDAAVREVAEETGLRCRLGAELAPIGYRDHRGRRKAVRYWVMDVHAEGVPADEEVDELRWLDPSEAEELLSYDRDRGVLREAVRVVEAGG